MRSTPLCMIPAWIPLYYPREVNGKQGVDTFKILNMNHLEHLKVIENVTAVYYTVKQIKPRYKQTKNTERAKLKLKWCLRQGTQNFPDLY